MFGTDDCFDVRLGDMHITALCDVSFGMDKSQLIGVPAEVIDGYIPGATAPASCTAYLVRLNGMTVLIDAGAGDIFNGRMRDALAKTTVVPEAVDHILLTHLHLDHVGGLLHDGNPVFPRAEVWMAEAEYAFWHDDTATADLANRLTPILGAEFIDTHVKVARGALAAYDGKLHLFSGEREILPGITAVPLHGHTAGHCGYALRGSKEKFFIWGDAVRIAAVQFALPDAGMVFDWDADMAVAARRRAFEMATTNGWLSAGLHLPFPGMGKLRRGGTDNCYCFESLSTVSPA